jgi:HTH-type transcriptional regulator/antitoxin HigA
MKKFSLTQAWVTRMAGDEALHLTASGTDRAAPPTMTDFGLMVDDLAKTETAREMARRKWINPLGSRPADRSAAMLHFLTTAKHQSYARAMFKGRNPSQRALVETIAANAWLTYLAEEAKQHPTSARFTRSLLKPTFLKSLAALSTRADGPREAIDAVRGVGINVIVELGLPGMSVDGASFHRPDTGPVIGLTLRHDRLDNFWFTLLHEVGHVYMHLSNPSECVFIDAEEDDTDLEEAEAEANAFAKDALIARDTWLRSAVHRVGSESAVVALAKQLGVHPAIVAGRLRYERRDFRIFNDLVGRHSVREVIFAAA